MANPSVLILDEPTSGLDPIMQNRFVEFVNQEKHKGKTIFMSSHIFEEVENTCDRILCIKGGKIIADKSIDIIKKNRSRLYIITFKEEGSAVAFQNIYHKDATRNKNVVTLTLTGNLNQLIQELHNYNIIDLSIRNQTIEELFMQYYEEEKIENEK